MPGNLKERLIKLNDKNNKSPLAKYFQNPGYIQDKEERKAQILFYKLLMIFSYADGSAGEDEINLIKNFAFEQCLSEQEWREIDFFKQVKPSKKEIDEMLDKIVNELHSVSEKKELLEAIREVINADGLLGNRDKEIFEVLKKKVKKADVSVLGNFISHIRKKINEEKEKYIIDGDSVEYSKNPAAPVLRRMMGDKALPDLEIVSAKLGLAIMMIHADMEFHEYERKAFVDLVKKECKTDDDKAQGLASELLKIPENYFETAYLARLITDSVDEYERVTILESLFKIARADKVYSNYEDNYLNLISKYLFIDHNTFIALKLKKFN